MTSDSSSTYAVTGFDAAGVAAGIKPDGALDLALVASPVPCRVAATFTRNAFPAAPVIYDRQLLALNPEQIHGVVINSGCANACTGIQGRVNARLMAEWTEQALGAHDSTVFVMSTGVIGVQLPMEKLQAGIPQAVQALQQEGWPAAAQAIMTTDTRPKLATRTLQLEEAEVRLTGMAKGSGMIHPNMATMLSVLATDVAMAQPLLQQALSHSVERSFNRITVDGDTSTNDTVLLLANGLAGNDEVTDPTQPAFQQFQAALTELCQELAQAIVRDGEGATKFVTIQVHGAVDDEEAHRVGKAVANSSLVKTAFYGSDANWGRIIAAVGYAEAQVDPERVALFVQGGPGPGQRGEELQLVQGGGPTDYQEEQAAAIFAQPEIDVRIELGLGEGASTVWTCDLSHEYVTINGEYRT